MSILVGALLPGLRRPLAAIAVAVVIVVLIVGTVRSVSVSWRREDYRAMAHYLDKVAGPKDPVIMGTILGAPAISAQARRPHLILHASSSVWSMVPRGQVAFLIIDEKLVSHIGLRVTVPAGFDRLAKRHYAGFYPTDIFTYRRR